MGVGPRLDCLPPTRNPPGLDKIEPLTLNIKSLEHVRNMRTDVFLANRFVGLAMDK